MTRRRWNRRASGDVLSYDNGPVADDDDADDDAEGVTTAVGSSAPSALLSATMRGRSVKRCSNSTVAAIGRPSCVAGRNSSWRAAATADSSKPKPAARVTLTSLT